MDILNTQIIIQNTINKLNNTKYTDFISCIDFYILTFYEIIDVLNNLSNIFNGVIPKQYRSIKLKFIFISSKLSDYVKEQDIFLIDSIYKELKTTIDDIFEFEKNILGNLINIKSKVFQKVFYHSNYKNINTITDNKIDIEIIFNAMHNLLREEYNGEFFNSFDNACLIKNIVCNKTFSDISNGIARIHKYDLNNINSLPYLTIREYVEAEKILKQKKYEEEREKNKDNEEEFEDNKLDELDENNHEGIDEKEEDDNNYKEYEENEEYGDYI